MPQPVLHIIHATRTLDRWRDRTDAPLDVTDAAQANAFLMGSLGPDMGLFPGGAAVFSRLAHTGPTGALSRALLQSARTPVQRAFALGWLAHVLADIAIHPLVNRAAASVTRRPDGGYGLADHVRVEVGLDIRAAGAAPSLGSLRLQRALARDDVAFITSSFGDVTGYRPSTGALLRMQAGMLNFTRLAIHFATRVAPAVCWGEESDDASPPFVSAVAWRLLSSVGGRESLVDAYMNPLQPSASLLSETARALDRVDAELDRHAGDGADRLANYNLETGALLDRQAAA